MTDRRWLAATWLLAVGYFALRFDARWYPWDEGTLSQSAWRVLGGELPHRDFDEMYTGLLTYLHAGAMAVLGESMRATRFTLLAGVAAWVPAVWLLARRFAAPAVASLATLAALALGPGVYPVAMPTWFALFLATWGIWFLLKGGRWLAAAGLCAGVATLFKIVGLYVLAAYLFATLPRLPKWAVGALVGALALMVAVLVRSQIGSSAAVHYLLPTLALGAAAVWRSEDGGDVRAWGWLLLGFALPVLAWTLWYAAQGALGDLVQGVLVTPLVRIDATAYRPLPLAASWFALVIAGLLLLGMAGVAAAPWIALAVGVLALALPAAYRPVWYSVQALPTVAVLGAVAAVVRSRAQDPALRALAWLTALFALVQFPWAGPVYMSYVAPLAALLAAAVTGARAGRSYAVVAGTLALFAVLGPNRGGLFGPEGIGPLRTLELPRAGLRVPVGEAAQYERTVALLHEHGRSGYMFGTPDVPELYFLAELANPTPTLFDALTDTVGRVPRVLDALDRNDVGVVVLNAAPPLSRPPLDLIAELERAYPNAERVGSFIVRWR